MNKLTQRDANVFLTSHSTGSLPRIFVPLLAHQSTIYSSSAPDMKLDVCLICINNHRELTQICNNWTLFQPGVLNTCTLWGLHWLQIAPDPHHAILAGARTCVWRVRLYWGGIIVIIIIISADCLRLWWLILVNCKVTALPRLQNLAIIVPNQD